MLIQCEKRRMTMPKLSAISAFLNRQWESMHNSRTPSSLHIFNRYRIDLTVSKRS